MSEPIRIQRRRVKGWKMPENTVYVGSPSKWGNQFKIGDTITSKKMGIDVDYNLKLQVNGQCVLAFHYWLDNTNDGAKIKELAKNELQGKNLACFCALNQPCHADILLKVANG